MPSASPRSPEEPDADFSEFARARANLVELVRPHREAINHFSTSKGFEKTADKATGSEPPQVATELEEGEELGGITTGFTCFESLATVFPVPSETERQLDATRFSDFKSRCLAYPDQWKSEGAARRYCIVRGVGGLLQGPIGVDDADRAVCRVLIDEVWKSIQLDPSRRGVFETPLRRGDGGQQEANKTDGVGDGEQPEDEERPEGNGEDGAPVGPDIYAYPPNAFLTYWALFAERALKGEGEGRGDKENIVESWLSGHIGRELALARMGSRDSDPQQLAWAISGLVLGRNQALVDRADGSLDLLKAGLDTFFSQQGDDGTWATGRPLFHYPEAGNAYCYVPETLAELVSLSLSPHPAADELRQMLRPYLPALLRSAHHLDETKRALGEGPRPYGWVSGHHPHRTSPEAWATASAFRFLQALRQLLGLEVRRLAASRLRARAPQWNREALHERGATWAPTDGEPAGQMLERLFVDAPTAAGGAGGSFDPDRPLFADNRARSAILFGPPGTGKTTLVDSVAGAMGWDFVEITPADFLNQGVQYVSARADQIFSELMELDRCVILFDEIDELIRARETSNDSLSRFFTTTMLPRLAGLWKQGKVMFFVNTNSISNVDAAIRRSQRFDAAIFVMPPGFEAKKAAVGTALPGLTRNDVEHVLETLEEWVSKDGSPSDADLGNRDRRLGWLPFITYPQMRSLEIEAIDDEAQMLSRLEDLGTQTLESDWREPGDEATKFAQNPLQRMVVCYMSERDEARVDRMRDPG